MAENKGKTKGSMIAAIQSAQMAVGSALAGGQASMAGASGDSPQTVMLLEDLREIGRENEKNTQSVFAILKSMFVFDKDAARRLRDQMAEKDKEKGDPAPTPGMLGDAKTLKEKKGPGWVLGSIAGLTALAAFMKSINQEDILRLPQQIKSIRGIARFVAGVTKIGTLGLGAKFIDKATDSLKLFKTNFALRLTELKATALSKFKGIKIPSMVGLAAKFDDLDFVKYIKNSKGYALAVKSLRGIKSGLVGVMTPIKNAFQAIFGVARGGRGAGRAAGALGKILAPLKAIGRMLGKVFLPLTLILAVFDGYKGFMEEWEKEQNFVDGIRGAVTGIVDGFVGGLITLVTDVVGWMLEKLGLEHLANIVREFGDNIRACLKVAVGGLVDVVTGIFTFDLERILGGLKNLIGGTANFMFEVITAPINAAIALVSDIFGWGDPKNPFTVRGFLFGDATTGEKGVVMEVVDWFKGLFSLDGIKEKFNDIKAKFFDMGTMAKAVTKASLAFTAAGWPGGESPVEAYKRVYDEVMAGGGGSGEEVTTADGTPIVKTSATDVKGNTTETTYKTTTINEGSTDTGTTPIIITDNSNKQTITPLSQRFETNVGSLSTSTDGKRYNSSGSSTFRLKRSDRKLKEDIKLEGKSPSGVNIYSFKYKGEEGRYKGVMAQETLKAAIFNIPGYLMVDYSKLDVEFAKIA